MDAEKGSLLGGWQLGVSEYSEHKQEAADFVFYLASREIQKMRAIEASLPPSLVELYEDEKVLKANPYFPEFEEMFTGAVARPASQTAPKYDMASEVVFSEVHSVLTEAQEPLTALENIALGLAEILEVDPARIDMDLE